MPFTAVALAVAVATLPALAALLRGDGVERLLALQVASADVALLFASLAGASRSASDLDLALALGVLSFVGALVLVRFVGRWA